MSSTERPPRRMLYALIVSYVVAAVFAAAAVFVSAIQTEDAVEDSQRKWCALLVPLDQNYQTATPPTESGKRFAQIIHELRVDFGC